MESIVTQITENMNNSKIIILLITKNYLDSKNCVAEFGASLILKTTKKIVPIRMIPTQMCTGPYNRDIKLVEPDFNDMEGMIKSMINIFGEHIEFKPEYFKNFITKATLMISNTNTNETDNVSELSSTKKINLEKRFDFHCTIVEINNDYYYSDTITLTSREILKLLYLDLEVTISISKLKESLQYSLIKKINFKRDLITAPQEECYLRIIQINEIFTEILIFLKGNQLIYETEIKNTWGHSEVAYRSTPLFNKSLSE